MENTSYALYIVVGMLIAISLLSLLLFNWRKIGFVERTKDENVATKNKAAFNAEYEAYNKKLMYGSDVLSCLNKAQNNNQKYVYNNYYGTQTETIGKEDREEYFIDVEVTLKSSLHDEIKAYYRDSDDSYKYKRIVNLNPSTDSNELKNNYVYKIFDGKDLPNRFDVPKVNYYYFKQGKVYQENKLYTDIMWDTTSKNSTLYTILTVGAGSTKVAGQIETNVKAGTYHLLTSEDTSSLASKDDTAKLAALITTVNLKNQELINDNQPNTFSNVAWWYCTWTTAASDFKSRKFKCTGTTYDENTGYITKISFEEV